ncbi:MAG: hypothetical protein LBG81_05905 [Coriobacteriaceae bacterium]|jgi:hypothetical protein|nr:hypothetical protein [Coriobacteriaceae bacterium]
MSDILYRFIPVDCENIVQPDHQAAIGRLSFEGRELEATCLDRIEFADAGSGFEDVCCPFCGESLLGWWQEAMDAAYSAEAGFGSLKAALPCCGKDGSLDSLDYRMPQGFYRSMIEAFNLEDEGHDPHEVLDALEGVTGFPWRLIRAYY